MELDWAEVEVEVEVEAEAEAEAEVAECRGLMAEG